MFEPGYIGGKASEGVYHRIIGQMPPHSIYVEPFLGSGAVFWNKRPAAQSYLIDKNRSCIAKVGAVTGVNAICGDAIKLLPTLALVDDAVVYCDPPYVLSTRKNRHYYDHEMTDAEHVELLNVLKSLRCRVLISGYWSELYSCQLQNWRCSSYKVRTRGNTATEFLWCNFPEPTELHDWRYAGRNFRERLQYKRLAARLLTRLQAMSPRKRGYLLNALENFTTGQRTALAGETTKTAVHNQS